MATEPATGTEQAFWRDRPQGSNPARGRVSRCLAGQPVQPQGAPAPIAGRWARPQQKDSSGAPLLPIEQISVEDLRHVAIVVNEQTSAKGDLHDLKTCQHPGSQPKDSSNGRSIASTKPPAEGLHHEPIRCRSTNPQPKRSSASRADPSRPAPLPRAQRRITSSSRHSGNTRCSTSRHTAGRK